MDYDISKRRSKLLLRKHFKPEFLNRLNDIVIFHPLNRENLLHVITLEIEKAQNVCKRREVYLELDEAAKSFLVDKGFPT